MEFLFVQTAQGMSATGDAVVLRGIAPGTLFFSDRPDRVAGHVPSSYFVDSWGDGEDSFAAEPPNAVLSVFPIGGGEIDDVVVELSAPAIDGDHLTYAVEVIEGELPRSGGPTSLFIDAGALRGRAAAEAAGYRFGSETAVVRRAQIKGA